MHTHTKLLLFFCKLFLGAIQYFTKVGLKGYALRGIVLFPYTENVNAEASLFKKNAVSLRRQKQCQHGKVCAQGGVVGRLWLCVSCTMPLYYIDPGSCIVT